LSAISGNIFSDAGLRLAMSFNAKTIAISAVALVAVAGAVYAIMPGEPESPAVIAQSQSNMTVAVDQDAQKPSAAPMTASSDGTATDSAIPAATIAAEKVAAPPKLTKEQVALPAPKTENEKLQRAAEGEYDRF
jgi:type IV secretory pathway VirB10-like protein